MNHGTMGTTTTRRGRGRGKKIIINEDASSMQPEMPSSAQKTSSTKKRGKKEHDIEEEDKHSERGDGDIPLDEDDFDSPDRGASENQRMGNSHLGKRLRQENGLVELTKKFIQLIKDAP